MMLRFPPRMHNSHLRTHEIAYSMKQRIPFQADDTEHGLAKDAAVHLGSALLAVDEYDWHFLDAEAQFPRGELHLDLESVAFETDFVEVHHLQYLATIANETGCGVVNRNTCDNPHVFRCSVAHKNTLYRPVNHIDTRNIARSD